MLYFELEDVGEDSHPVGEIFFELRVQILVVQTVEDLHEHL